MLEQAEKKTSKYLSKDIGYAIKRRVESVSKTK
jgi:hypothetical protein